MMTQITEMIWLGDSHDALTADLAKHEIKAILNVAHDLQGERGWSDGVEYAQVGLVDGPGNSLARYHAAVLQLAALVQGGRRTLVHCHKGQSRSPAVIIMYLNLTQRMGWEHWRAFIAEKRKEVAEGEQYPHEAHRTAFNQLNWRLLASVTEG